MEFNNKTILIIGLVIGGIGCIYVHNNELASAIFGGLIGYLAKDPYVIGNSEDTVDGTDSEIA